MISLNGSAGLGLLEAPRRAQKIEISYARTAKKVDIKALKVGEGWQAWALGGEWERARNAKEVDTKALRGGVESTPV